MDEVAFRATALLRVLVPFLFFMASIYLALHIMFARVLPHDRPSAVLWFFSVVTGPLTRPVRALVPHGTPESWVRALSLAMYVGLWIASRVVLGGLALRSR